MKKRILIVLAIVVLLSLTVFAACQEECQHQYEAKWDGEKHWQECKLCHETKDEAVHALSWVNTDATNHWQACSCGYTTTPAAHADGNDADELCDTCGRNLHEHVYTWQSDVAEHWQVCACGDKQQATAHVDVKNNETEAEGADGKCDVCARENYAVTFNMQNHGAAVEAQVVYKGGKAAAPEAVADVDAWKFGGWYKEAACEHEFVFANEVINEATVVYAKWTEDTTEGASKAHAYVLTLDTEKFVAIQKDQVVYLAYTASLEGRYTVSLGNGTVSQKCTFTADKAQGTYDGEHTLTIDLAAGDKLYVALTCADELDAEATAGILIAEVTEEALPQDYFLAGEYFGTSASLEITDRADKDHQTLVFNDKTYTFRYVGGSLDRIYFVQASEGLGNITYYLAHKANGTYVLSQRQGNGEISEVGQLEYRAPQEPVALNKLFGYYEPKNYTPGGTDPDEPGIERDDETPSVAGGITNGIIELYIYVNDSATDTSVRYKQIDNGIIRYSGLHTATYDAAHNTLTTDDSIVITLNLAQDGSIESINVRNSQANNVYVRKSDTVAVPPESLPLEANEEYRGETHAIRTPNGSQLFGAEGNNGITVMAYDDETGLYTIAVNSSTSYFDTYKLTISEQDGIKLYQQDGTTLLDTLTKYVYVLTYKNIATDGSTTTLVKSDFYQGLAYFKVTATGWYTFTDISNLLIMYANVPSNKLEQYSICDRIVAGSAIYLEEDAIIVANCSQVGDGVSFVSTKGEAPKGMSAENPYEYEEGLVIEDATGSDYYYVKYTATADGDYTICAYYYYESGDKAYIYVNYQDGEDWLGEITFKQPYLIVSVTDEQELLIRVIVDDPSIELTNITVEIAEYVPVEEDKAPVKVYGGVLVDGSWNTATIITIDGLHVTYVSSGEEYTANMELNPDTGKYGFSYTDGENNFQTVTITIVDGALQVVDSYAGTGTVEQL